MKLIVLRGLPASGKSTYAKKLIEDNPGVYKRVNRDLLREMVDAGKWSKSNEKLIVKSERELIFLYLLQGFNVIVDDTNLSETVFNTWKKLAEDTNTEFEVVDFTHVTPDECINRDRKRPNYVGEKVIKKMYLDFIAKPMARVDTANKLQPAWIFDIDGTLALHNNRSPYDLEKCEGDTVNESIRTIMNNIQPPRRIFLLSGRHETYRPHTERWLRANEIEYTNLFMRKNDDNRNDDIVKRELYEEHIHGKYNVMGVFDDRIRVCRLWHSLNLPVYKLGDPDADF